MLKWSSRWLPIGVQEQSGIYESNFVFVKGSFSDRLVFWVIDYSQNLTNGHFFFFFFFMAPPWSNHSEQAASRGTQSLFFFCFVFSVCVCVTYSDTEWLRGAAGIVAINSFDVSISSLLSLRPLSMRWTPAPLTRCCCYCIVTTPPPHYHPWMSVTQRAPHNFPVITDLGHQSICHPRLAAYITP